MLNKLVSILGVVLICYSSSSYADSCGYAYDPELGWQSEVSIASGQAEPISEVPVPVTVITSQMIKDIGGRNLKDVLITYVSGITFVQDYNEVNVATRGIYGASNKILIMLNGHRLNSRSYSMANPDYSISLDKIECIEVLRTPSPLYGDVALAALINIITKKGTDMGGTEVNVGLGNHGQRKLSFVHGNEFENGKSDLLLWGAYYKSDGETVGGLVEEDYSDAIVDGFDDPPSYDIGINYEFGDLTLLATQRYSKYIQPRYFLGESYNYPDYRTIRGIGPGLGSKFSHLGIDYDHEFDNGWNLQLQLYYDENEIQIHVIDDPSQKEHRFLAWYDRDGGVLGQLSRDYNWLGGSGTWMVGTQIDMMEVYDSEYIDGKNGEWDDFFDTRGDKLLDTGKERLYSAFTQIKHRFNDNWIGNFGLRFDKKKPHKKESVDHKYPYLAIIWLPDEKFDMKLSYSKAFLEPSYWQRNSFRNSQLGIHLLEPEYMDSIQLTPTVKLAEGKMTSSLNFFYNKFSDSVWLYGPLGKITDDRMNFWGIENETSYRETAYNMAFNLTYQASTEKIDNDWVSGHKIHNVPNWTANAVLNFNPLELFDVHLGSISDDLWVNITARYIGKQLSPFDIRFYNGEPSDAENNEVDDVLLFNTGFRWNNLWKGLFLDGRVYNLRDEKYYQGGTVSHPYPQPGLWWMVTVGYQF